MTLKEYLSNQLKDIVPDPQGSTEVNDNSKVVFVNGYWSKYFKHTILGYELSIGPNEGGENYWVNNFFSHAEAYFNLTNAETKFADGSSQYGGDQSGADRVIKGENWAERNYNYLISNSSENLDFYLVGHSEGGAFAVGIANYLNSRGHNIKEILLLSCDEADEFAVNSNFPTFQIVLAYWKKMAAHSGTVYWEIKVDWVVGDHWLRGATKYGVVIGEYGIDTVHGYTNSVSSFNKARDLKSVYLLSFLNQLGEMYYTQNDTPYNTKFYTVNNIGIAPNHPAWNPETNTIDQ